MPEITLVPAAGWPDERHLRSHARNGAGRSLTEDEQVHSFRYRSGVGPGCLLLVTIDGSGGGTVTGAGINCTSGGEGTCSAAVAAGTAVSLVAAQNDTSVAGTWSSNCAGGAFTMPAGPRTCPVTFNATAPPVIP